MTMRRLLPFLLSTALCSPAFAFTAGNIVTYSDTTGAHVQDSGILVTGGMMSGLTGLSIGTDQRPGVFGTADILAGNAAGRNSIIGEVTNTLPPATPAFPAGLTGYGKLPIGSDGNTAFGAFAVSELYNTVGGSVVGAEFTVRNISGRNPDTNLPPSNAFGTTSINTETIFNQLAASALLPALL